MAKKNANVFLDKLINDLTWQGEKAIRVAYRRRDFTNRLYNLRDSYGSAVYYNGRLLKHTIRYLGPEMGKPIDNSDTNNDTIKNDNKVEKSNNVDNDKNQ